MNQQVKVKLSTTKNNKKIEEKQLEQIQNLKTTKHKELG